MEILEGYKWVVLHGGGTLIPKVNSEKFNLLELTLPNPIPEDPSNEELVDWGDDDDQDFMIEDFTKDITILKANERPLEVLEDLRRLDKLTPLFIDLQSIPIEAESRL